MATVQPMTEEEARETITQWAESYYGDDEKPDVEILSIVYHEDEEEWEAELEVSTSADNPTVTFWMSKEHGLRVNTVEY